MKNHFLAEFKKTGIIFIFFLIIAANFAFAAPNLPFIDKGKIRVAIAPGKQGYGEIFVENPTEESRLMRLYLEDWYYLPSADGAKEFVPAGTMPHSCASWINFSPAQFILPAFAKQRISYSIKVPENASGAYYAALFFETEVANLPGPAAADRKAGIDLKVRIASLFYVEAAGTIDKSATLSNFSLRKDNSSGGLTIEMDFTNTGNVDITAAALFYLMNQEGIVVARGQFNDVYTAPRDKAKLATLWKKPLPKGIYDVVITLNLDKAQQETGGKKTTVITKEAQVEINAQGEVVQVGKFN